jgi:hypothetical protein
MTFHSESPIRRHVFRMVFRLYRLNLVAQETYAAFRDDVVARDNFCTRWEGRHGTRR